MRCYKCLAEDEDSCIKYQTYDNCPLHQKKLVCLTQSYQRIKKLRKGEMVEKTYKKKCVTGDFDCEHWCRSLKSSNVKNCQVNTF